MRAGTANWQPDPPPCPLARSAAFQSTSPSGGCIASMKACKHVGQQAVRMVGCPAGFLLAPAARRGLLSELLVAESGRGDHTQNETGLFVRWRAADRGPVRRGRWGRANTQSEPEFGGKDRAVNTQNETGFGGGRPTRAPEQNETAFRGRMRAGGDTQNGTALRGGDTQSGTGTARKTRQRSTQTETGTLVRRGKKRPASARNGGGFSPTTLLLITPYKR